MNDHDKQAVDDYMSTVERLEPYIHMIDPGAFYASAAISLKRIADNLDVTKRRPEMIVIVWKGPVGLSANLTARYLADNASGVPVYTIGR